MPVVVTGAAGFIGRHLVARLVGEGQRVVTVDRLPGPPGASHLQADLADAGPRLAALLADADAVFHLAGLPGVRDRGALVEARRWRDNVVATEAVLRLTPLQTPLVVTSSSSVYGGAVARAGAPPRPSHERDELRPLGGYAASKVAMERRCAARVAARGHVVVVRPFTVVGAQPRADMALARWVAALRAGTPVVVYGGLHRTRDLTRVDDVVTALCVAAEREVTGTFNLGTGYGWALGDVLAALAEALDATPRVSVVPALPEDPDHTRADTRRCAAFLGEVPSTDLDALAREVALATVLGVPA